MGKRSPTPLGTTQLGEPMSRRPASATGGTLIVAILIGCQIACHRDPPASLTRSGERRPELAGLVTAVGADRPFEARLTGGFSYGPYRTASQSLASAHG